MLIILLFILNNYDVSEKSLTENHYYIINIQNFPHLFYENNQTALQKNDVSVNMWFW